MVEILVCEQVDLPAYLANKGITDYTVTRLEKIDNKYKLESLNDYIHSFSFISEREYNIGLIEDAQLLSELIQNKLLKTLEESNDNTIHILTCTNTNSILDTILSRSEIYKLSSTAFAFGDSELEKFAKTIVRSNLEYQLYQDDIKFFQDCYELKKSLSQNNPYLHFKLFSEMTIDDKKYILLIKTIQNYLYENKLLTLLKESFEYEKRCGTNANYRLQLESLLIKVDKKKVYDENSHWN